MKGYSTNENERKSTGKLWVIHKRWQRRHFRVQSFRQKRSKKVLCSADKRLAQSCSAQDFRVPLNLTFFPGGIYTFHEYTEKFFGAKLFTCDFIHNTVKGNGWRGRWSQLLFLPERLFVLWTFSRSDSDSRYTFRKLI